MFAVVAASVLARHEMWLDELNPWVIARDARSWRELFYNVRFEPHPRLWYVCLYLLSRMTRNPIAMQVFHGAIATASVAVLAYRSPFTRRDDWLLAFGYYFVFEYCAISRGYALGLLLALSTCALASTERPRVVLIAVLLALLANTSIFGLIIAGALTLALAPLSLVGAFSDLAIGICVLVTGFGLSVWSLVPSPESTFGRERHVRFLEGRFEEVSKLLGTAYFPLPDFVDPSPWNSSFLVQASRRYIPIVGHLIPEIVGGIVLVLAFVHLRRRPAVLAAFASGTAVMLLLMYVEYSAGYRHHGHLFILLVLVLWLASTGVRGGRAIPVWFPVVLAINLVAGVYFVSLDIARPFSASKALADFFVDRPPQIPIVVAQPHYLNYAGPPLSAYSRRRVYYAISGGIVRGSYLWYDEKRARGATEDEIVNEIARFAADAGTDVYVVASHWESARLGTRISDLPAATIEGDERTTTVYLFKKPQ